MKINLRLARWTHPTVALLAMLLLADTSRAASPIVYNFTSDLQGWSGNEPGGEAATYSWNATGGSSGGGCMQVVFAGTNSLETNSEEIDPWVTLPAPLNEAQYLSVTVDLKVDPNSGTIGTSGSGGYGNLQVALRDASYSWDSIWYGTIYPPAANGYVTYQFYIQSPYKSAEKYLQIQLSGGTNIYSGSVTCYVDNVTISPVPDPWVMTAFTNNAVIGGQWDSTVDAPFYNPVTHTGPTNITPPGSWMIQIADPGGYSGWNQYQTPSPFDSTRFQNIGFDVYLDGSTGNTYGGTQMFIFKNGWASPQWIGAVSFNASMVGKWTHFDFPGAVTGITASPAFVFQGTPGTDGGTNTTTFHIDNVVLWSPLTLPTITSIMPGTTAGVKVAVDADGTANQYDQEGFTSPDASNHVENLFWLNQSPATYSFTISNFPSPAVAPGFDAHIYLVNGDSIASGTTGGFNYNETYSGVSWNAYDFMALQVQNSQSNNGVVCNLVWKTNAPSSNATNGVFCTLSNLASVNGTWALNFTDNTHGSITLNGSVVTNFTLPDFLSDPNYTANFTPGSSWVNFGLAKNDVNNTGVNNNQSAIFTHVVVTNSSLGTAYDDAFPGPGLTGTYAWQVAEYYQDAANRISWQPPGTAWWLKWNTSANSWTAQSSSNLLGGWANAGLSYSYVDGTGTNTYGAVPQTNLPAGGSAFFRLVSPAP